MKTLVTGGAGFIGSHIVDRLIDKGIETSVLVSGFRSDKHPSIINERARIVKGDLREYNTLLEATKGADVVFHLGGVFSHYCDFNPELAIDVNIKGMLNLKNACVANQVKRIIFASSSFVYGQPASNQVDEWSSLNPKDLLGITKLTGEKILQATHPNTISYTILRLFNVYGPRQYPDKYYTSVISTWIKLALQGKSLEIHDNGTQSLDFVFVEDVADAFIASLNPFAENQIFNVASGQAISMNELAAMINLLCENKSPSIYNRHHLMFLKYVRADISMIRDVLRWTPKRCIEEGLKRTIEFFKDQ